MTFRSEPWKTVASLVNIKTGRAQLIYDGESVLHDLDDLLRRDSSKKRLARTLQVL